MHHYVPMNQDNHINLVIIKNPFDIKQRELKTIKSESEIYLKKFLEDNVPSYLKNNFWVAVNGHVYKEEINLKFIRPGDYVVVCPVVQGGGNGSNPLAILAGLALAFFSFGMVQPWVAGMFGKTAGLLAGGLTMMAGGQLISNAFSPSEIAFAKATLSAQIDCIPLFSTLHPVYFFPFLQTNTQPTV